MNTHRARHNILDWGWLGEPSDPPPQSQPDPRFKQTTCLVHAVHMLSPVLSTGTHGINARPQLLPTRYMLPYSQQASLPERAPPEPNMADSCPKATAKGDIWLGLEKDVTQWPFPASRIVWLLSPWGRGHHDFYCTLRAYFWLKAMAVTRATAPAILPQSLPSNLVVVRHSFKKDNESDLHHSMLCALHTYIYYIYIYYQEKNHVAQLYFFIK